MFLHRSGYHPSAEMTAIHCRRRYRLLPPRVPNPNLAPADPSLWLVHYSRAPPSDHIPASRIPLLPPVQNMLAQRRFLLSNGRLARKDFMLHDRNSWPTINFPPPVGAQEGFVPPVSAYANPMVVGRHPSQSYPQPPIPGAAVPPGAVPTKLPRGRRSSTTSAMNAMAAEFALEEEDVSTGDPVDLITPREISKMRYKQHHEWMEEIFASPYAVSQIMPVSLGLGRKGELETLTAGFFDVPVGPSPSTTGGAEDAQDQDAPDATKLEPGKAEEFADRVSKKIADMTAEIEKMKKQHTQKIKKFSRTSGLKEAERRLRESATDPAETGPEIWRLEGRIFVPEEGGNPQLETKPKYKVEDIVRELENTSKKRVTLEPKISCVQKGGLLEKIEPTQKPDEAMEHADSHLLDQFGTPPPGTTAASTQAESHPQALPSGTGSSAGPGPAPEQANTQGQDVDVDMHDVGDGTHSNTAAGETGDWVMVNNETSNKEQTSEKAAPAPAPVPVSENTTTTAPPPAAPATNTGADTNTNTSTAPGPTTTTTTTTTAPSTGTGTATATATATGLDGSSNFDFSNIDTAGDALAAYTEQNDGLDMGDLDNSAFGDAFHATDNDNIQHHHEHEHERDPDEMS